VLSRRQLLIERSQIYLRAGMLDPAMADLDAAIGSADTGAEAYFLRASAWEGRRDAALRAKDMASARLAYQQALADLEKASALAEKDGQDALVATSRMRMAMLLQQAGP
jgi:tetratricopeptide (TPR) repeat protein